MEEKMQAVLDSLEERPPRSRLESYGEFIDELRRRGRSVREIARILADTCQVQAPRSTVHDFIVSRARRIRKERLARARGSSSPSIPVVGTTVAPESRKVDAVKSERSTDSVMERIAELKQRPAAAKSETTVFEYDPDLPLQLPQKK